LELRDIPTPTEPPPGYLLVDTLKRFSNFESATVRDAGKLDAALEDLQSCIDDPLLETRIGQEFRLDQFDAAMSYEAVPGAKAVFIP
jgi:NADPH2:quinone reductase